MNNLSLISLALSISLVLGLLYTSIISLLEKEIVASTRSFWGAILLGTPLVYLSIYNDIFAIAFPIMVFLSLIIFLLPIGKKTFPYDDTPTTQIDERDVMFARNKLIPDTARFNEYYNNHPEFLEVDNNWRKKPGLTSLGATTYNKFHYASADASFIAVSHFHNHIDNPTQSNKSEINSVEFTNYLKNWSKKLGALDIGITEMKDYHYYSHTGRGDDYGVPITQRHKYGICITVEMDKEMMSYAPKGPTVMESAQQYMNAGVIAIQLAEFIRLLGYPARAHIDGKYQVVCPLVARDAGMGEIGRMGLLMTPKLGPRVRLAVVTSDIPLITDKRINDYTMIDFCIKCKKCADVCPSKSISFDNPTEINGVKRWQINQESCFDFWCQVGTDCGRCVSVCPYSHPDNFLHNVVRFGIKNSSVFRSVAARMDDVLYGKIPPSKEIDNWLDV